METLKSKKVSRVLPHSKVEGKLGFWIEDLLEENAKRVQFMQNLPSENRMKS